MGKSNFLNALCWCLYEDQPFKLGKADLNLLNEDSARENEFEEVKVAIEVQHDNEIFLFTRTKRESQNSYLNVMIKSGENWENVPNPNVTVDNFLPKSVRQFFLFDGEAVQNLFKGDYSVNLKESIWKVSHVAVLDTSIAHLDKVVEEQRKAIAKGEPELDILNDKINGTTKRLIDLVKQETAIGENLITAKNRLDESRKKYLIHGKEKELEQKRIRLDDLHKRTQKRLEENKREFNELVINLGPFAYIQDSLREVLKKINEGKKQGNLPPKIANGFIHDLVDAGTCICGTHIGTTEKHNLDKLVEENEIPENKAFLLQEGFEITSLNRDLLALKAHLTKLRAEKSNDVKELERIERELKEVREQLLGSSNTNIVNLESLISRLEVEIDSLNQELGQVRTGITRNEQLQKQYEDELSRLAKAKEAKILARKKYEFALASKLRLVEIRLKIIDRVRMSISENTDKFFKSMMWKKGEFDKVTFTPDYQVEVVKTGEETSTLENLSTGEQKLLGFATIKALTELSGFKEVPVFIDGPLEYLDQEVQESFLHALATFMPDKQVFVFSPDRELIINYGQQNVAKENFYKVTREAGNNSTVIKGFDQ